MSTSDIIMAGAIIVIALIGWGTFTKMSK